jgi:zinc protease
MPTFSEPPSPSPPRGRHSIQQCRGRSGPGAYRHQPLDIRGNADATTRVAPIVFRERTLANGLRVISARDKTTPTVAIQVWYHVGSKDDPPGRSGFAHLFEHLMFKRTRNMKDEMLDRLTEDVGGENNAYTSDDVTVYHEVVPSNYLQTLLWAEADRMSGLIVDDKNFKSERDVVKEEYRQSVLAPPYGKLGPLIAENSFAVHPYKRDTIGNIADLNAAEPSRRARLSSHRFTGPTTPRWSCRRL